MPFGAGACLQAKFCRDTAEFVRYKICIFLISVIYSCAKHPEDREFMTES